MLAGGFLFYQVSLQPVRNESTPVEFQVAEGDSISSVITRLEEQDIIKSKLVSNIYAKFNGLHNIKVGYFQLDSSWNAAEILRYINDSNNAGAHQTTITFREGIWARDIANKIEAEMGIPASELLALWNDDAYITSLMSKYTFLDERVLNDNVRVKLEGYLFPETYSFAQDATKEEITETFLTQFDTVYKGVKSDLDASGMSLHDAITLASMIQHEASSEEDMYLISGVFHNRLNIGMTLGSSVTICYALYDDYKTAEDCEVNSTIDSPYNTYVHTGLPIGPILNPGKTAIQAAIKPKDSEYLYFMADIYGDGSVHYAKTQEEHDANVNKYLR